MSDCFVSYKREDRPRVEPLVSALRAAGVSVWWDQDIGGGEPWRQRIAEQLDAARCVVVCWTHASTGPDGAYVREEAERAKTRGVLLPVRLDAVAPPFGFGEVQALDLTAWNGATDAACWRNFVATLRAIADGRSRPPPVPPGSPYRPWRAAATLLAAVSLIGLIIPLAGWTPAICRAAALREACRATGVGGVPARADEEAWAAARQAVKDSGRGDGYRAYLRDHPAGAFAAAAQAALAACRNVADERWQRSDDALPLVVPPALSPAGSEAAARERSAADVQRQADALCAVYEKSPTHKLLGATPDARGWRCRPETRGWTCAFDGQVVCQLEARRTVDREACS
ncbi:toll/interleukin-1 receptor domain-containing protein [Accumulibacter sp.]|uniref:toll/interleukin-1 receptor domain-containing protein n=1 Tax=Accumulibacter sp. TaxID=2053492 RepID=UPI0026215153|nr:toll/interleukin-1 receptor domain-containing protein [Accumulibacter sp.]